MTDHPRILKNEISEAFWCSGTPADARFEAPSIAIGPEKPNPVAWFDRLFKGGIHLSSEPGKPRLVLLAGLPDSGETTLALELCYRAAKAVDQARTSLDLSMDADADQVIENTFKLG